MNAIRLVIVALFAAACALAQVQAGRIVGAVTDPNKAVVPGAKVRITAVATNQERALATNEIGEFVLTPVDPGFYNVEVVADGFQTIAVNNLEVVVGQSARVDVELKIGQAATKVEVTSTAPLLNTESGSLGQVITNTQIVNLPLNGRGYYELARLAPGATLLPGTGNLLRIRANYESGTSISGVSGVQTSFFLDGADVTDRVQGGTLIQTSIDALQEFQVQQSEYSAEFGTAGGLLNVTTKSGASQFHGGVFEFLRNDKLDSRNFFALTRDILKRNQFGAFVGGPVSIPRVYQGKNRTFFFINYEGMRQRAGQVFNNIVPSVARKNGDFSAAGTNAIYDPTDKNPFPGNVIPRVRLSAQALFFNRYIPDPNAAGSRGVFAPSQVLNQDQATIRIDQTITDKHRAFVRWSFLNYDQIDPNAFPTLGTAPLNTRGQNLVAALTSNLKPSVVNQARFSYMPNLVNLQAFFQGTDFYKQAGVTGFEETGHRPGVDGAFPDFSWSGYAAMNGSAFDGRPKTQDLRVWEVSDNVTWVKRGHIFKFGAMIHHWTPLLRDSQSFQGQWNFNGTFTQNPARPAGTGDAFADYMLGLPFSVARGYPLNWFGGYGAFWHFFAQDDFKVTDRLTLNLGLRYEYSPWLNGYRGQVGTFLRNSPKPIVVSEIDLDAQFAAPTAYKLFGNLIQTAKDAGFPSNVTYNDNAQWAPRFGLAWRPFGTTTVVRGGYGIFYEVESSNDRVNTTPLPYSLGESVLSDGTRTMANYFLGRAIGSAGTTPNFAGPLLHLPKGYDQHWSLGVQQELGRSTVFEADYVGNKGSNLNGNNPANDAPAGPGAVQPRRPFPLFGAINLRTQDVSSTYNALQVKAEKRAAAGLWFLASYAFSKSITARNTPPVGGDYAYERALSAFDIPHNFTVSAGYELPIARKNRILGGWQLQSILVLRSGRPFTPTISRDVANTGFGGQRPNRIGSGKLDHPTLAAWFDKSAFTLPANFTYGNSGGSILRENRSKNIDLSLFKQFQFGERVRAQFRAEAFNLTNTASFNAPNTVVDTAAGGQVLSTISAPRNVQFALKVLF